MCVCVCGGGGGGGGWGGVGVCIFCWFACWLFGGGGVVIVLLEGGRGQVSMQADVNETLNCSLSKSPGKPEISD